MQDSFKGHLGELHQICTKGITKLIFKSVKLIFPQLFCPLVPKF